ncbi:hypothetical protein D9757_004993 [Collybiopsis confluens]|uniref:EthD domain-containing protein n=1 Tax=Collybiopsis confluens TaxID=2823264 RepID=A0A8H5HTP0_9AGAR|nr:hypothetical protein D9757_004993 [Collybiopsis confluens]
MPVGFLIVYSEPGAQATLDEYQDWYNNEHVPLRMNHLKSFLTGARYSALDSQVPSWTAVYDVEDIATFSHESYTRLRANRSPREADLVKRLSILDRQTSQIVADTGESTFTTSLASKNPSKGLVTHGLGDAEESARRWFENVLKDLGNSEGWVRSRLFKCIDSLKSGVSIPSGPEAQVVPKYFVVHEFLTPETASAFPIPMISSVSSDVSIANLRRWGLYKAYPGIAQGSLESPA